MIHRARGREPTGADGYDVVTWGHSQGGHAALWMGQLLEPYATATATADSPSLSLAGVALEAPASVLVAQPGDPDTSLGAGLFDWTAPADAVQLGDQSAIALIFSTRYDSDARVRRHVRLCVGPGETTSR